MKKRYIKTILLLSLMMIYIVAYRFIILKNFLEYTEFITASMLMALLFIAIYLFPYQKDKITPLKKQVTTITVVQILLFFSLSYLVGMFVGFLKNSYSLTLESVINNLFSPIIIIICTELFRYVVIRPNQNKKKLIFLITLVLILFELFTNIRSIDYKSIEELFKITTSTILPTIVKNFVLSYLTLQVGYRPALVYRLIMDLYVFVMPIVPNLGDYINSMIGICLPFLLYIYSSRSINEYYKGVEYEFKSSGFQIADIPIITFILLMVCLVSGYFPYYIIGIGSESMNPKIYKGDAVIIQKIKNKKELKVGQVIVYNNQGEKIVHRLVEIEKKDGKTFYRTKGDNNNTRDNLDIEYKDLRGIVKFKIPYIAIPTIYLSENLQWRNKRV